MSAPIAPENERGFVYPYLQKLYLIALLYPKTNISNDLIYGFIKHCPSIFRRKHHVIQQHRYIMTLMNILAHASTLRPKGRGINPVEIQTVKQLPGLHSLGILYGVFTLYLG